MRGAPVRRPRIARIARNARIGPIARIARYAPSSHIPPIARHCPFPPVFFVRNRPNATLYVSRLD